MHVVWIRIVAWFHNRAWPLLAAALATLLGLVLLRGLRKPVDSRTPQQRRDAERDSEIVRDAISEHMGVADVEQAKAKQAGARAAYFDQVATEAPKRVRDLSREERKALNEKTKAALRKYQGGLVVLAIVLSASTVRADEQLPTGDWTMTDSEHAEYEGWAAEALARRQQVVELHAQVASLETASHRERTATEMCTGLVRATQRRLEATEKQADALAAWYRNPRLWGGAGVVVGAAAVVLVAMAVQ